MTSTLATQEEMKKAQMPLGWRDQCSAEKNYLPWECEHEKHAYEKCQYDDYVRRMTLLSKQKKAALEDAE
ncbi:nadh-ubiquinone oxidoreductase b18 [Moniliophthora roreri]|uniref:NADH dehydrogenase [ubiquinone] 1 beta subcomplex subunit 7 n=1 Tax=Moniliophthora roreri TaxID=221103 RepID=A0A0W0GB21_MONRR|nr:nadh-ubiquinone oxidoreductase b18 [Moniliophthora roreri]